jgi:hypothetical protein
VIWEVVVVVLAVHAVVCLLVAAWEVFSEPGDRGRVSKYATGATGVEAEVQEEAEVGAEGTRDDLAA